jgi:hypothetical protein
MSTLHRPSSLSPLYARYLSSSEKSSIRQVPADDLSSEIKLLRVLNSLLMKFQRSAPRDLYSRMQILRTCVILNEQLALCVRMHDRAHGSQSEVEAAIDATFALIAEEEWKDA